MEKRKVIKRRINKDTHQMERLLQGDDFYVVERPKDD